MGESLVHLPIAQAPSASALAPREASLKEVKGQSQNRSSKLESKGALESQAYSTHSSFPSCLGAAFSISLFTEDQTWFGGNFHVFSATSLVGFG